MLIFKNKIGYITDKEALPLSKLHFGRSFLSGSSGRYTLGKLECSGRSSFTGKPTGCQDLYKIGHVLNGFYPVKSGGKIDMIYRDFALLSDPNGGTEIGDQFRIIKSKLCFQRLY